MTTVPRSPLPAPSPAGLDVAALRAAEFPWAAERIYLDAASIGPLPERTIRVLEAFNRRRSRPWELGAGDCSTTSTALARQDRAPDQRRPLGDRPRSQHQFRPGPRRAGPAARARRRDRGQRARVSRQRLSLDAAGGPWGPARAGAGHRRGWPDEARLLERIEDPRVRILAVSLTQFSNGYTVDLDRLSRATRRTGTMLVVDAIQAIGQLPVDLARTPVDLLSCGGQKWLLSPWGSGFIYVRRELIGRLDPAITGWMAFEGTDDFSRLTQLQPVAQARCPAVRADHPPVPGFRGDERLAGAARGSRDRHGSRRTCARSRRRSWTGPAGAGSGSPHPSITTAPGSCASRPEEPAAVHHALRQAGVTCSLREGSLRLSPHCYTTVSDMERVAEILEARVPG